MSHDVNCAVTGFPIRSSQAAIIPIFVMNTDQARVSIYDHVKIIPFIGVGEHDDGGVFEMDNDDPQTFKLLNILEITLKELYKPTKEEIESDNVIDLSEFSWDLFFELCHQNTMFSGMRLSYTAIELGTFNSIFEDYQIYGPIDRTIQGYVPENVGYHGFETFKSMFRKKFDEDMTEIASSNPMMQSNEHYKVIEAYKNIFEFISVHIIKKHLTNSVFAPITDHDFEGFCKIHYLINFFTGINRTWPETCYANIDVDTAAFKVLQKTLAKRLEEYENDE